MVEPVTAVLTGIALVKNSVDFIKTNIATAQDVGDIIGHVDKALNGQQQIIKDRDSKNLDHFATENVAKEINFGKSFEESVELGINLFNQNEIDLDYLEIVDEENFKYPNKNSKKLKLLTAAYVENVRLIDNIDIEI